MRAQKLLLLLTFSVLSFDAMAEPINYALWAQSGNKTAIEWSGSDGLVEGATHSNGGIKINGSDNRFSGGLTRVKRLDNGGSNNILLPLPEKVNKQPWPLVYSLNDYAPGGRAAVQAGKHYFNQSAECDDNGKWDVSVQDTELESGLYWVPCDVVFSASNLTGQFTVVSTGLIEFSGSDQSQISSYIDGVLLLTHTKEDLGIKLSGSTMLLDGYLSAKRSAIELSGSDLSLQCGVYAKTIKSSGSNIKVTGSACGLNPNIPPVADAATFTISEDTVTPIVLTASDVDGDALTYQIVSAPQFGTLSGTAPNLTYLANPDYAGSDAFSFTVNDGLESSEQAVISIDVTPENDQPTALSLAVTLEEDTAIEFALAGNDTDGDSLTYNVIELPSFGDVTGTLPNLIYTPPIDFTGEVELRYVVNDGLLDSAVASVTLNVTAVNDPPEAASTLLSTLENTALPITLVATDVDSEPLTYLIVGQPENGTLTGQGDSYLYTPNASFVGVDQLRYVARDEVQD